MFKRIQIHLSGPICSCDEHNLIWNISINNGKPGLILHCATCNVQLDIPNGAFKAGFYLDTPYPGKQNPNKATIEVEKNSVKSNVIPIKKEPINKE